MDPTAAATLFAWLDRELWLVTAEADGKRGGMIATFVNQASLTPDYPRVVVGIARHHFTWGLIEASNAFALHLLGQANFAWLPHFGVRSGHDTDKLAGWNTSTAMTGSPILADSIGWLDCSVEARLDSGDRTLYLAQVVQSQVTNFGPPMTAKQLQQHVAPDVISELKLLVHRDSLIDAKAIREWREQHGIPSLGQQSQ
jgi:flavin reductase (DIM6/NTAB) family NADH-FMN oxidoreductase RutF